MSLPLGWRGQYLPGGIYLLEEDGLPGQARIGYTGHMADEPNNLVLEHLRHMRGAIDRLVTKVDKLEADVADLKPRILGFETTMGYVMAQVGHLQVQIASQTARLDRMDGRLDQIEVRLDRIEKRLDLIPA
jgi:hypothetical protein